MEVFPHLTQEVKEGQAAFPSGKHLEEGVEGVQPAVEAAWGGDVGEEGQVLGPGQGLVVLAAELHGGAAFPSGKHLADGQGEDDAGGHFGLGVSKVAPKGLTFVAHRLEGIVYDAKGRYDTQQHSGLYIFRPKDRWQLGLRLFIS